MNLASLMWIHVYNVDGWRFSYYGYYWSQVWSTVTDVAWRNVHLWLQLFFPWIDLCIITVLLQPKVCTYIRHSIVKIDLCIITLLLQTELCMYIRHSIVKFDLCVITLLLQTKVCTYIRHSIVKISLCIITLLQTESCTYIWH
jgi:hypothetical protein